MPKEIVKKRVSRGIKTDFDNVVFYTTMLLVFIGIIMVFSASFIQSTFKLDDSYFFKVKEYNLCNHRIYCYDFYI
ncbi:hypothetical protein [Paraclostridium sp. AKS73]|uniref:hypothetical protein n=1 Tax=Paraclostridium sp. AKS73 TaxID=2876116 RepID=UPI0021DF77C6|nr:hypothetical protein [Paraclostridium sp. AKS73]MCU9813689.1 hypothetical protein [Paraclostridium sp. AKS73]